MDYEWFYGDITQLSREVALKPVQNYLRIGSAVMTLLALFCIIRGHLLKRRWHLSLMDPEKLGAVPSEFRQKLLEQENRLITKSLFLSCIVVIVQPIPYFDTAVSILEYDPAIHGFVEV